MQLAAPSPHQSLVLAQAVHLSNWLVQMQAQVALQLHFCLTQALQRLEQVPLTHAVMTLAGAGI